MKKFSDYFRIKSKADLRNDFYDTLIPFVLEILEKKKRFPIKDFIPEIEKKYSVKVTEETVRILLRRMEKRELVVIDGKHAVSTHKGRSEYWKIKNFLKDEKDEAEEYARKIEKMKSEEIKMLVRHVQAVSNAIVYVIVTALVIVLFIKFPKDYQKVITFATATATALGASRIKFGDIFKPRIVRRINERYEEYYERVEQEKTGRTD